MQIKIPSSKPANISHRHSQTHTLTEKEKRSPFFTHFYDTSRDMLFARMIPALGRCRFLVGDFLTRAASWLLLAVAFYAGQKFTLFIPSLTVGLVSDFFGVFFSLSLAPKTRVRLVVDCKLFSKTAIEVGHLSV